MTTRTIDTHTHICTLETAAMITKAAPKAPVSFTKQDEDFWTLDVAGVVYKDFPTGGHDIPRRLKDMDATGVDVHVLSATPQTYLYGLGVAGAQGVAQVVNFLRKEFEQAMMLCGRPTIAATFHMRADGAVTAVSSADRARPLEDGTAVQDEHTVTFGEWVLRGPEGAGVRVPLRMDARWDLVTPFPYARLRVTGVSVWDTGPGAGWREI